MVVCCLYWSGVVNALLSDFVQPYLNRHYNHGQTEILLRFWGRHRSSLRYAAARDGTLHLRYVWLHTAALRLSAAAQFLRSAAHRLCCRALRCRARGSTPHRLRLCFRAVQRAAAHPMVPRARQNARVFACAAAQFNVLSHPMVPRAAERSCLRLFCRAVQRAAAHSMVPRARQYVSSSSSVVPRTLILPRSIVPRTCMPPLAHGAARAAKWSQVLCVAASHGAAQFYMLPRSMLPRSSLCCRVQCCRATF